MLVALKRNGEYSVMVPSFFFCYFILYIGRFLILKPNLIQYDERAALLEGKFFRNVKKAITYNHRETLR
jgi:hypothetical protein